MERFHLRRITQTCKYKTLFSVRITLKHGSRLGTRLDYVRGIKYICMHVHNLDKVLYMHLFLAVVTK